MPGQSTFEPTDRTRVRRLSERGTYDRETILDILDEGILCHVGFGSENGPVVIPMGYARRDDHVLLHGSAKSRLLRALAEGQEVCITVTLLDQLVLARSAFHHSMNYRSVVIFGKPEAITENGDKAAALTALVEHLIPGRSRDARGASAGEMDATIVVKVPIGEASAKIRKGPPVDATEDLKLDIWAGVVPLEKRVGTPIADDHTPSSRPVPDYVSNYPSGRS